MAGAGKHLAAAPPPAELLLASRCRAVQLVLWAVWRGARPPDGEDAADVLRQQQLERWQSPALAGGGVLTQNEATGVTDNRARVKAQNNFALSHTNSYAPSCGGVRRRRGPFRAAGALVVA